MISDSKLNLHLFLLILLSPFLIVAADSTMLAKQENIENHYRELKSKKDWISVDTVILDGSVQPGYAIYKSSESGVEIIITQKYDKFSKVSSQYYMKDGKPFFVYSFRYVYNRAIDYDSLAMVKNNDTEFYNPKKSKIVEERDYFEDGKLIKQITNLAKSGASSEEFLGKETYKITKEIKILLELRDSHLKLKEAKQMK